MNVEKFRSIARAEDAWAEASAVSETARQRLFSRPARALARPAVKKVIWMGGTCTALGLAAAFAITIVQKSSHLSFAVGSEERHGTLGKWVSAAEHEQLPLTFSDGTKLVLADSAEARVTALQVKGAHVVLERGKLTAAVVHQKDTHWELQAGPFTVFVRGTRFALNWSPEFSTFALELNEGKVDVTGPGIPGNRSVVAGESLQVSGGPGGWRIGKPSSLPDNDNVAGEPVAATSDSAIVDARELPAAGVPVAALPSKSLVTANPSWQELATAGSNTEALALARKAGLPKIYASGTATDLTRLAQVARFAGDAETARGALRAIRERFAGGAESAMATFDLGRLAFDSSGKYLEAAHWFRDYLQEFPHGNLAREARGRLVESLERGGDHLGAREAASDYLLRYPNGPHSGLSRRLLNR
jgi:TolA-binding protein